jgi:hypothetical protein
VAADFADKRERRSPRNSLDVNRPMVVCEFTVTVGFFFAVMQERQQIGS